jgi:hypothetical protein
MTKKSAIILCEELHIQEILQDYVNLYMKGDKTVVFLINACNELLDLAYVVED